MSDYKLKTIIYKFATLLPYEMLNFTAMKKYTWIGVLLLLPFCSLRAGTLDSLLQVSINEKDPQLKCDYYLKYINKVSGLNRDSAVQMLLKYEDSCGTQFDLGRYRAQSLRAYYYCFESKYEASLRLLHEALSKQKAIPDASGIAQTMNRLGLVNSRFGRSDLAMQYLKLARAEFIRLKDTSRLEMVLNNMGAVSTHKTKEAIGYYRQSLAIRLSRKDYYWVGYSYFNIGSSYLDLGEMDSAKYYLELAITTFETKTELGKVPPMVRLGLANLYGQTGALTKAYSEVQKGLEGAEAIGQTELLLEGKMLLSNILSEQKKYEQAFEALQQYLELKLSVDSSNNAQAVAEMEAKYQHTEQALQIEQLSTQKLDAENKAQLFTLYTIGSVAVLLLFGVVIGWVWLRRNQREKIEHSVLNTKIAEAKMFALRAQMNPHFIFNCINTAQHFVMNNQREQAYEYLSNFAKLLRLVMENSAKTFIPLEDELEQLKLYMELEAIRFNNKFHYTLKLDSELGNGVYEIPGMLIQPIIENAIGHGLINRNDDKGTLLLQFKLEGETIVCEITDNGVGRERAAEIKAGKNIHYQSAAIPNIQERLNVLQKETGVDVSITITDLKNNSEAIGTKVVLIIPYQ
ncbi:MAG: histidine kinase [Bacteroidota bacterium]